jgi:hypothetical protein
MTEAVVPYGHDTALMPTTFDGMMHQAEVLVKSGLLPTEIKTAAAAAAIMLTGRELGIPTMQSFRGIYVVRGKPSLSAQLMAALIRRAGHDFHVDQLTDTCCQITFARRGGKPFVHTFTIDDAQAAGLTTGTSAEMYRKYAKAMLFSRCMSAGARIEMSDVIAGMYTPEELADPKDVSVNSDGEVVVTSHIIESQQVLEEPIHTVEYKVIELPEEPDDDDTVSDPFEDRGQPLHVDMTKNVITPPHLEQDKTPEQKVVLDKMTLVGHRNEVLALLREAKWNSYKQAGHIAKWFKKTQFSELTVEELVTLKEQIREDIAAQKKPKESKIPEELKMPEGL